MSTTSLEMPDPSASEQLVMCHDKRLGMSAVIAIDNTTLGPGLGGVRFRSYDDVWAGAREAQRLARGMTAKNALAGLPYGGAKSVILDDGSFGPHADPARRREWMLRFGEFVAGLGGRYLPGVDMGTTAADLSLMAEAGADATCSREDPSPWTALGVYTAIHTATMRTFGVDSLAGVRVLVQGVGHVGHSLAKQLHDHGAVVTVTDVDLDRAHSVADAMGAAVIAPEAVVGFDCDVWAPCATAKVITADNVAALNCRIVAGAANDTLASDSLAQSLADRGVLYVPDFVANAGGVIHIHGLRMGWDHDHIARAVEVIGERVDHLLDEAAAEGVTPLAAAAAQCERILATH